MFDIVDTTEHFIFDPIKKVLSKLSMKPTPVPAQQLQKNPIITYQSKNQYPQEQIEAAKQAIKYMETRGEAAKGTGKDYSFYRYSGDPTLGDALGAYQITETTLKDNAKKFLGRNVSRQEFLNKPEMQDKFYESEHKYLRDMGYKIDSLFAAHKGGWGHMDTPSVKSMKEKNKGYMTEAMKKYNEFLGK